MTQKPENPRKSKTQSFYDRIADVHNLIMQINGYQSSVAKHLRSLDLKLDEKSLVLDAGSGTGIVTLGFYKAGFRPKKTFAVDLSFNSLKISREQFEENKETGENSVCVVQGNILNLPFADETFDLILSCGVLEYVSLSEGLKEFARVLKSGANLVLIPVRPSIAGSILERLYNFKTHSIEETKKIASQYFEVSGVHKFSFFEPIGWSKMIFLLQKK